MLYLWLFLIGMSILPPPMALAYWVGSSASFFLPLVDASANAYRRFGGQSTPIAGLGAEPPPDISGKDPAFRGYLFGPAFIEAWMVARATAAGSVRRASAWSEWVSDNIRSREFLGAWRWITSFPIGLATQAGIWVGLVTGWLPTAVVGVVFAAVLAVTWIVALTVGLGLRVVELAILAIRGITVECPQCHNRVPRPAYVCSGDDGCDAVHKMLMPGFQGVLNRTCRCGRSLPTVLLLGKHRLVSKCSLCGAQLPTSARTAPTVHIPVAGPPRVGKSVFMFAAVKRLSDTWEASGSNSDFWGDESFMRTFIDMERRVRDPQSMLMTTVKQTAQAYNLYVGRGHARRLVYLYDAGGELYKSVEELSAATFYGYIGGVILCVDPFSLAGIRQQVDQASLSRTRSLPHNPHAVLETLAQNIRENLKVRGSQKLRTRLAVTLTKSDALGPAGIDHPYSQGATTRQARDGALRDWVARVGSRADFIASIDANFERSSFFIVSHADAFARPQLNDDPAAPLLWAATGAIT